MSWACTRLYQERYSAVVVAHVPRHGSHRLPVASALVRRYERAHVSFGLADGAATIAGTGRRAPRHLLLAAKLRVLVSGATERWHAGTVATRFDAGMGELLGAGPAALDDGVCGGIPRVGCNARKPSGVLCNG